MAQHDDFHTQIGFKLEEWREDFARISLALRPQLLNRSGILHGGVLMTTLDEVGALAGVWCSVKGNRRSSVTVDLDCRLTGQSREGTIVATSEVVSRGRSLYFTRSEVRDAAGRMLAYGSSTHKWRRGSETVEGSPPAP